MMIYSAFPVYLISAHIERLPGGSGKGALRCRADWTSSHWPPVWRTHRSTYCTVRWPSASASTSSPMDLALVSAASSPSLSLSLCVWYIQTWLLLFSTALVSLMKTVDSRPKIEEIFFITNRMNMFSEHWNGRWEVGWNPQEWYTWREWWTISTKGDLSLLVLAFICWLTIV